MSASRIRRRNKSWLNIFNKKNTVWCTIYDKECFRPYCSVWSEWRMGPCPHKTKKDLTKEI